MIEMSHQCIQFEGVPEESNMREERELEIEEKKVKIGDTWLRRLFAAGTNRFFYYFRTMELR